MKALDAIRTRTGQTLLAAAGGVLMFLFLIVCVSEPSQFGWAIYLTLGAAYVTAQVRLLPNNWRSRSGSLLPATCLVALVWIAAGVALAAALLPRH